MPEVRKHTGKGHVRPSLAARSLPDTIRSRTVSRETDNSRATADVVRSMGISYSIAILLSRVICR